MRRPPSTWPRHEVPRSAPPIDVVVPVAVVTIVWVVVFGLRRGPAASTLAAASVAMLAWAVARVPRQENLIVVHQGIVVLGIGSAVLLFVSFRVLYPILERVAAIREGALEAHAAPAQSGGAVAVGLLVLVALAEEVFWRGFVQGRLSEEFGDHIGFLSTLAGYVACHVLTLNLALVVASAVCGAAWGWFRLRSRSIVPGVISHVVWTQLVFHALPL